MREVELYHHGIKGQKWGIRRFQNLDGTLTALGRRLASSDKVPQGIRDRARFALAKKSYDPSVVSLQKRRLGDQGQHLTRSQFGQPMFSPGFGEVDPRHYITRHKNEPSVYGRNSYVGDPRFTTKKAANEPERGNPNDLSWDSITREAAARKGELEARRRDQEAYERSSWENAVRMHNKLKELDKKAAARSEAYRQQHDADQLRSAQQEVARAKKKGDPQFFYEGGVKKERASEWDEKEIQRGRAVEKDAKYQADLAKYRKGYETDKFHDIDDSSASAKDRGWSFDRYLAEKADRRGTEGAEARSFLDSHRAVKRGRELDDDRTWKNGQMSFREQQRQDSLRAVDRYNQRRAAAEAQRQRAEQMRQSEQRRHDEISRAVDDVVRQYSMPSQSAARSAMSTFSNPTRSPNYHQTISRVSSAARSTVSSYATKARVNAGKTFTNYLTKMAEAAKNIDADTWSF